MRDLVDDYVTSWLPFFRLDGKLVPDVNVAIDCSICCGELAVAKPSGDFNPAPFAVLACGHVFGHSCIFQWFEERLSCPKCRKEMVHPGCGHEPALLAYEGNGCFNVHTLPQPLAHNKPLPNFCFHCVQDGLTRPVGNKFRLSNLVAGTPENESTGAYLLQTPVYYMVEAALTISTRAPRPRTLEEHLIHYELLRATVGSNWRRMSRDRIHGLLFQMRERLVEAQ
ncbi:hypothetical protein HD806DRAFT_544342 [Xylariaceae sp. AK1471]|nr:hypothetical protein HD806DRAFT_544342 [Xylariaceae sp. AK1471]